MDNRKCTDRLDRKGIRVTPIRILVLDALMKASGTMSLADLETELETVDKSSIFRTLEIFEKHHLVHSIDDGDSLRLRGVDFGRRGAKRFTACVASAKGGCSIEIHLDHAGGPLVGTLQVESTGGQDSYREMACEVSGAKKTHDLVFVFRGAGKDLMQWDWWRFE